MDSEQTNGEISRSSLKKVIEQLPETEQKILSLVFVGNLNVKEAAEILEVEEEYVIQTIQKIYLIMGGR